MKSNFYESIVIYILKWLSLSLLLGFLGANLVFALRSTIRILRSLVQHNSLFYPLLGGLLVGLIIYYFDVRASGVGTNRYIEYAKQNKAVDQVGKLLISKFSNTSITLGLMGVEGLVGPILLLGSSLALSVQVLAKKINLNLIKEQNEYRVLHVCGAAAALGPLLGAPIGSGIFVSEVLYESSLNYNDLFPAILSGGFGYFFYNLLFQIQHLNYNIYLPELNPGDIFLIIIVSLIAGFLGQGIILIYNLLTEWVYNLSLNLILKPVVAGLIAALLIKLFDINEVLTKMKLEQIIFSGLTAKVLISLLLFKILITIMVISSGGSVAMVDTAILAGGLLGNLLHFFFPLPLNVLVVTGMSAILASLANVPLATIILISEIFGVNLSLSIILGSIIGFLIGRAQTVYQYLEME